MPDELYEILKNQYGDKLAKEILQEEEKEKYVTLRVNTIKSNIEEIKKVLSLEKIEFENVSWYKDAFIIKNVREDKIRNLDIYNEGKIYMQSLSSMLPPIILNAKEGENVLDMAAAPGGKTTQIAAMGNNKVWITACEKNKIRCEKLKYNIEKQGVKCVNIMTQDARNLNDLFSFDKILLDAPCSGSGTESIKKCENIKEKLNNLVKTQEQLLKKALKLLKQGNDIVYSTCSIIEEENENIVGKILEQNIAEIVPIKDIGTIETLPSKIEGTQCIKPSEFFEGFFIAKLRKK